MILALRTALTLVALTTSEAYAADRAEPLAVDTQFTTAAGYAINLSSGTPLPPTIAHGLGATLRLPHGWGYNVEVAGVTSMSALQPCAQVVTGPTKKVSNGLGIGVMAMYRCAYAYDGTPPLHIIGISAAPAFPLRAGEERFGSVSFPLGISYLPQTEVITVVANVKLTLLLPKRE